MLRITKGCAEAIKLAETALKNEEELALENGLDPSCDLCPTGDFGHRKLLLMATLNRCLSNGGTSESLKSGQIYLEELKRRQGNSFTLRIKNH